jgi:hypothetical protein
MSLDNEGAFRREMVTVEAAKQYLASAARNRNIRWMKVYEYAQEMKSGRWMDTGEPIKFNDSGQLIDGQHRLRALVESSKPQEMLIVRRLKSAAMPYLDCGMKRSIGCRLEIASLVDGSGNEIAAIARALYAYEKTQGARLRLESLTPKNKRMEKPPLSALTTSAILKYVKAHLEEIKDSLPFGRMVSKELRHGRCFWSVCFVIFGRVNRPDAVEFISSLADGVDLKKADPAHALRTQILRTIGLRRRIPHHELAIKTFRAWNNFREGVASEKLHIKNTAQGIPLPK